MSSLQLLNSTFKRICDFTEKCGFKIRDNEIGVAFYFYPNLKLFNYDWLWKNKKDMLLGGRINDYDIESSLFSVIISRYEYFKKFNIKNTEPLLEPLSAQHISENTSKFIDMCRYLKDCSCLEELVIKMDLLGI